MTLIILTNGLFPFLTVAAFAYAPNDPNVWTAATLRSDTIHVLAGYVSLRLAVTFKYAFQPRSVYARRLKFWAPSAELSAEQLVTGWRLCNEQAIRRGVDLAAAARHEHAED